jgi:hypothetical protein
VAMEVACRRLAAPLNQQLDYLTLHRRWREVFSAKPVRFIRIAGALPRGRRRSWPDPEGHKAPIVPVIVGPWALG